MALGQFVEDIKSGARKTGSDDYAPGTVKAWKSFIGVYEGFDPMHQFTVEPIAKLFAVDGREVWLTTSAVWMAAAAILLDQYFSQA